MLQEGRGAIVDLSHQKIYESGVGYWLVHHKHRMSEVELNQYLSDVSDRYDNINIEKLLSAFAVTHIYSINAIATDIKVRGVTELRNGSLYHVGI
jgi:hypothetical protein